MAAASDFSKMVPGFDFLQGLVQNTSSALPSLGQWVAPTLDPEELGKRIEELKTVQFWLEQNARMIGTTVQALEVQRMTLTTLKTMNVQAADLAQAFKLQDPAPEPSPAPPSAGTTPPGVVDPMQWWGALTQQFTQLAAQALKDRPAQSPAGDATPAPASGRTGSGGAMRASRAPGNPRASATGRATAGRAAKKRV